MSPSIQPAILPPINSSIHLNVFSFKLPRLLFAAPVLFVYPTDLCLIFTSSSSPLLLLTIIIIGRPTSNSHSPRFFFHLLSISTLSLLPSHLLSPVSIPSPGINLEKDYHNLQIVWERKHQRHYLSICLLSLLRLPLYLSLPHLSLSLNVCSSLQNLQIKPLRNTAYKHVPETCHA